MADLDLLEKTQKVMKAEQKLTALLEKVEPWLGENQSKPKNRIIHYHKRVRPIPQTMDQVNVILAMARNWASKTSAPAGWDPNLAPVMGFATPNPLPHQLRGGTLAALQLERVTNQKYQSQQQQLQELELESKRTQQEQDQAADQEKQRLQQEQVHQAEQVMNPKKRKPTAAETVAPQQQRQQQQQQKRAAPQRAPSVEVTMNLSSSSDDEDDDDESD